MMVPIIRTTLGHVCKLHHGLAQRHAPRRHLAHDLLLSADDYGKLAKVLRALGEPELAGRADEQAKEVRQALPKGPKKLGKNGP